MCKDFQLADSVSVGETESVVRPSDARCWFTRLTTSPASDALSVPQLWPGVQLPSTAPSGGAVPRTPRQITATSATALACLRQSVLAATGIFTKIVPPTARDEPSI
jgi:hypothetical protein